MDTALINSDPDLLHAPQGRLFVTAPTSVDGHAMVHQVHPVTLQTSTIGVVDKAGGRGVCHGLYGNRPWELIHVLDQADRERELREQDKARESSSASHEFKARLRRALSGVVNPAEELARAVSHMKRKR